MTIVGDYADLLVLMLHQLSPSHYEIFLQTASKIINIRTLQDHINPDVAASLLFLHALTGYHTVSRQYGIGKVMAMGKCDKLEDHDNVNKHGQPPLEVLYSCTPGHSLDMTLREQLGSAARYLPDLCIPPRIPPTHL